MVEIHNIKNNNKKYFYEVKRAINDLCEIDILN